MASIPKAIHPKLAHAGGILPSPETLREIDNIVPGSAERIFAEFEKQSEHYRTMEARTQQAEIAAARLGQIFGLVIGLAAIAGGSLAATLASGPVGGIAGGFIGGGGVIRLVSVFVGGRYMKDIKNLGQTSSKK
jgi:uncharacterized membrane protein